MIKRNQIKLQEFSDRVKQSFITVLEKKKIPKQFHLVRKDHKNTAINSLKIHHRPKALICNIKYIMPNDW